MSNRILNLSAAAAMIVATPALATAQSLTYSTSPVAVTSCSVSDSYAPGLPFNEGAQQLIASVIALNFVNRSSVAATTVKFLLNDGKYTQSVLDKGTFAPSVQLVHTFAADGGTRARQTCNVAEVDFADGSAVARCVS
jgi:hypothetical protein